MKIINRGEVVQAAAQPFRLLFVLALLVTLVSLLTPGELVLAFKQWVYTWVPFAVQLDEADFSHNADKLIHTSLFATMGFLAVRGWTQRRQLVWVLIGVMWLAPQTEWLQVYVPGRGASWADVAADVAGLAAGVAWGAWVLRRRKSRAPTLLWVSGPTA
jgi:VanZ family protein